MVKIQLTVVLTTITVADRFFAYITQNIHSKRCDEQKMFFSSVNIPFLATFYSFELHFYFFCAIFSAKLLKLTYFWRKNLNFECLPLQICNYVGTTKQQWGGLGGHLTTCM